MCKILKLVKNSNLNKDSKEWERVKIARRQKCTRAQNYTREQNCTKTILDELHYCTRVNKKKYILEKKKLKDKLIKKKLLTEVKGKDNSDSKNKK